MLAKSYLAGMMNSSFFVGRVAILEWLNSTFDLSLTKVEQTASGAVLCQILDAIYGDVPMHKVRWDCKAPHEMLNNYKII